MKALSGDDITSSMSTQSAGVDELRRPRSREDAASSRPDRGKTARWERWNDCSERWGRLMLAARGGDGAAYEQLLRELDLWLRAYYARRLPYPAADDARQEVLLAIHAKRHTFTPSRPFGAWVTAIARYKWVDRVRDASRYSALSLEDEIAVEDHEGAAVSAAALDQLLGRLKPAQESVIRLVKLNGLSIARASGATGQSAALVKINIHRGLKKLAALVS
ncbi:sigma-70 family RNA polymerase sigma factor [Bradyrhizobium liaoningense]|uniref:sigma-70 family RNA polymerase sigma factor n=1 Tax=Bradyrhizobium liaoningense TaxID=43992 RepID=UPI001BAD40AD|nr:sigma-70 family RNA polymerase sigma factor [Bradyrhizobium liaoningense]MBR0738987.1 sigma-70 family RNA polymerase sigma factor [Bradyrhizobium liaoningense]